MLAHLPTLTNAQHLASLKSITEILSSQRFHKLLYIFVPVVLVTLFLIMAVVYGAPVFQFDDSYITLHNAQVLLWGADPNYESPALVGATSVVHTVVVTGLLVLLPPLWALMVAQWIGVLLYALGVIYLGQIKRVSTFGTVLLLISAILLPGTPYQLLNGLETGLMMAAAVWSLALAGNKDRFRELSIISGILPFIRPELAVLSVLLLGTQIYSRRLDPDRIRWAGRILAFAALGALPWVTLLYANTGHFLPTSISAKRLFFAEAGLKPSIKWAWLSHKLTDFVSGLWIFAFAALFFLIDPQGLISIVFILAFVASYYLEFPGALGHYAGRYMYALLPFLVSAMATGLARQSRLIRYCAFVILLLSILYEMGQAPAGWRAYLEGRHYTTTELADVAKFCSDRIPTTSRIMVHDAGYIAYATRFHLVDFVGLKTPAAIELHRILTFPTVGRRRAEAVHQFALRTQPEYLVMLQGWDQLFQITNGLRSRGWELEEIRDIPDNDGIAAKAHYSVYKIRYTGNDFKPNIVSQTSQMHDLAKGMH